MPRASDSMALANALRGMGVAPDALTGQVEQRVGEALTPFVGPENPPVNAALQGLATLTGPENPPVHALMQGMQKAQPVMDLMQLGANPAMILSHGSPLVWAPEPGAPLGRFRRSFKHQGEGSAYRGAGAYLAQEPRVTETYRERAPWVIEYAGKELDPQVRRGRKWESAWLEEAGKPTAPPYQHEIATRLRQRLVDDYMTPEKLGQNVLPSYLRAIADDMAMQEADLVGVLALDPKVVEKLAQLGKSHNGGYRTIEEAAFAAGPTGHTQKLLAQIKKQREFAKHLRDNPDLLSLKKGGAYYSVDFPDELLPSVLKLDAPMREQTPEVMSKIKDLVKTPTMADAEAVRVLGTHDFNAVDEAARLEARAEAAKRLAKRDAEAIWNKPDKTGWDLYEGLGRFFESRLGPRGIHRGDIPRTDLYNLSYPELSSRALSEAGIPAQNFLDQFSRNRRSEFGRPLTDAELTRNFVVFDPDKTLTTVARHETLDDMIQFQQELAQKLRGAR